MKRRLNKYLIASVLCSSFLFSSCGRIEEDPNKIIFWHTFGQEIENVVQNKVDEFERLYEEHTGEEITVELEYQGGYDEILDKIERGFAVGNIPTIAVAYPDHVADYLALETDGQQWVYNLEDFFDDPEIGFSSQDYLNPSLKGAEDFVPSFLDEGSHYIKEGIYSLPLMKSSEILLYNEELLALVLSDYDPTSRATLAYQNLAKEVISRNGQ